MKDPCKRMLRAVYDFESIEGLSGALHVDEKGKLIKRKRIRTPLEDILEDESGNLTCELIQTLMWDLINAEHQLETFIFYNNFDCLVRKEA